MAQAVASELPCEQVTATKVQKQLPMTTFLVTPVRPQVLRTPCLFLLLVVLASCETIKTGDDLDAKTVGLIKHLGLLAAEDEQIVLYYSNYKESKAGSFFTNKRIAHYWLDRNTAKNDTSFAFYNDIVSIDTVYKVPDFDASYMEITARDSSKFRAYTGGSKQDKRIFFEKAISLWRSNRRPPARR